MKRVGILVVAIFCAAGFLVAEGTTAVGTTAEPVSTTLFTQSAGTTIAAIDAPTTVAVAPTPPQTTVGPNSAAESHELDVRFDVFCDELLGNYVALLAEIAGVPARRISYVAYGTAVAVEFGTQSIFTVRIAERANRTDDPDDRSVVAERLERRVNALAAAGDHRLRQHTVRGAVRVVPEARVSERGRLTVNYIWVAFLLLGVIMLGASGLVLMRRRSTATDDTLANTAEEEMTHGKRPVPRDAIRENEERLMRIVSAAEEKRVARDRDQTDRATYAPRHALFESALDTDYRLRLPPHTTVADPLAPGFSNVAPASKTAHLGRAARSALDALHDEIEEEGMTREAWRAKEAAEERNGAAAEAAAQRLADEAEAARRRRHKSLQSTLRRNQLMDANDDDDLASL